MVEKEKFEFIDLNYRPKDDLICLFRIKPARGLSIQEVANQVALESSVGTWDKVEGMSKEIMNKYGGKVFHINKNFVKIAYPTELFELGNMPSILSGIAGNIFGMKVIEGLRLEDIDFSNKLRDSFKGPKYGIEGVRKLLNIKNRPLIGTIVKPKVGLNSSEYAEYAYRAWKGGLDLVKSDENLTNQNFNRFQERCKKTIKIKERVEKETGEKKLYVENVTAETKEMLKRAKFIQDNGGNCAMIDIVVSGWSAFQTLRNEDLNLVIHCHRAGHGMFTENPLHGMSMLTVAKIARLIGGDNLHIGGVFGKMRGKKDEVIQIEKEIEEQIVNIHDIHKGLLKEEWGKIKPMFSVCSGGIHPGTLPRLIKTMGKNIICQAGGGVSAHPLGVEAGAKAMKQALDASLEGINLKEYSKTHKELRIAIDRWGYLK